MTGLPIILKGLATGSDIDRFVASGVDALILSNHGGRVFDGLPAAPDVLPHVIDLAGRRMPVLVDGGFRSGSDIATALAPGARAVLIGRPVFHALAVAGFAGVAHMCSTSFERSSNSPWPSSAGRGPSCWIATD